jgi:hypothetical protein
MLMAALVPILGSTSRADLPGGCDFDPVNTKAPFSPSCVGPLSGSTFAGGDGNLLTIPTTFGTTDWQNVAGRHVGIDLPSGTGDNAFGQGTKEDDPAVTVVTGSIPPSKSDLTRFYEASEFANGSNFLYLAWERNNALGNANMDFEINQVDASTTLTPSFTGATTLNRSPGDLLVTFDFANGGGKPVLGLLTWLTGATTPTVPGFSTKVCLSSSTFPCWGDQNKLTGDSEGAVNNIDAVSDPISGSSVPALEFGELAINLTAAGVFPPGTCKALGSAFVKSRASSSFPAEVKDFIAPVPVNISNCGAVKIIKHTDPRGLNQSFSYTSNLPAPVTVGGVTTPSCTATSNPSSFTLNDNGLSTDTPANTESCSNVPANTYTVTEGTEPANFTPESLSCITTGSGGSTGTADATLKMATIILKPNDLVTCTYVNKGSGAILVSKTAKNHNSGNGLQHPLGGAVFTVNGVSKTTDNTNGQACFDGLTIGTKYTVTETSAPSGYAIDTTSKDVTVSGVSSCTSGTPTPVSFTDSPLTDLTATATSEIPGVTNSQITCVDSANANIGTPTANTDPASFSATDLKPGTYKCTVVIDP